MNFNTFNFNPLILSNIATLGYETPTPIQQKSLPIVLSGQDVMGLAQTGTGKTAAFALPIIQHLMTTQGSGTRALIIAPTRELSQQIYEAICAFSKGSHLKCIALYGGVNITSQIRKLASGIDIVVGCPGRLLDHLQQGTLTLKGLKVLVLDEADHMFDMGFLPDIRKILRQVPKVRQTLLFSATMPPAIHTLAQEVLHKPAQIKIENTRASSSIKQLLFPVPKHLKLDLLIHLLHKINKESVIVFTKTKHTAKKIALKLEAAGFKAASLQGNLSQNRRDIAMKGFRDGSLQILVATDIVSRGIDVSTISHVINFDIPSTVEAYVHRIGRTGRAAKEGEAFTFIVDEDLPQVRAIERVLKKKIEQCDVKDFNYDAPKALGMDHDDRPSRSPRNHQKPANKQGAQKKTPSKTAPKYPWEKKKVRRIPRDV